MTALPKVVSPAWLRTLADRTQRFADARLGREQIRFIGSAMLATNLVLLAISFATSDGGRTAFSPVLGNDNAALGGDYAAFHGAGDLLNHYPARRLYDLRLQYQIFHKVHYNMTEDTVLYYANPPFFALLLRPLALLPYSWSYLAWLAITLGLYLAGFRLVWKTAGAVPRDEWPQALLLALSFPPFLRDCFRGGQLSAFGFFWVAVAAHCGAVRRPAAAGAALGLCLYKPTLLVLILPMLLIGRQFRTLLGFAACGLGLALVSLAAVGPEGCRSYPRVLQLFSDHSTSDAPFFPIHKYADLSAFLTLAHGRHSVLALTAAAVFVLGTLAALGVCWWNFPRYDGPARRLLVASTLTLTAVLSLHVGFYDTIIVVPGVVLTAGVLYERSGARPPSLPPAFKVLLALVYLVPFISQLLASAVGFQPYTLVLAALGWYQLLLCRRIAREASPAGAVTGLALA